MRLIDTDNLKFPNIAIFDMKLHGVHVQMVRLLDVQELIPAVDAVEVVRCRDCRYYRREPSQVRPDADVVWCDKHNDREDRINLAAVDDDWFCADGERRREDG